MINAGYISSRRLRLRLRLRRIRLQGCRVTGSQCIRVAMSQV